MDERRNSGEEREEETGGNRTEQTNLKTGEMSSASEIKKEQKGSSLPVSHQTASAYSKKNEKERRLAYAESKDKDHRLSFLNVFKFHRRNKSLKELTQASDSVCDNIRFSNAPEKSNDTVVTTGEFATVTREELSQDTGIERSVEVGALPEMTLDEGQKKSGRWQHIRTRLQHRMTLPNKPEVNLSLDLILTKKKSIQRKQLAGSGSVKSPSKPRHYEDDHPSTSNSLKVFWPRKTSLQSSSFSGRPSEDAASAVDTAQPMHAQCTPGSHTAKPINMRFDHLKAARGDPFSVGKERAKTSSEFNRTDNLSPQLPVYSPHSKDYSKSDSIIFDQKISTNRNVFQAFIQRRRVLKSMADDEQETGVESRASASAGTFQHKIMRHSSQLQICSFDDPKENIDNITNGTIYKSQDEQNSFSGGYSFARIQKKAASLPDLINCNSDDNIFEMMSKNDAEITNVLMTDTNRNGSKSIFKQNLPKAQNLQKKKRLPVAAYRDKNDLNRPGLHDCNQNDIGNEDNIAIVFEQRIAPVAPPGESNGILRRRLRNASGDKHAISSTVMFARKSHGDIKKSAQKILDPKKDLVTRLKHLRIVLESFDIVEAKAYFEQYFSILYFLFYESFTNVETNLWQRVSKGHREELDFTLLVLERILVLLPDLIHKRWQLSSIGRIMKKLLHPGNSPKLRKEGVRLFLMWYEILMDNATEDCHKMFKSLIPRMLPTSFDNCEVEFVSPKMFLQTKVLVPDIVPLLPCQAGEVQPDEPCRWFLDCLLAFMVSEVNRIQWINCELHEYCLKFLFDKFKDHYLPRIFPELVLNSSIYEPSLDLPERILLIDGCNKTNALCQEAVIKWITRYTLASAPENQKSGMPGSNLVVPEPEQTNPGSNASTLSGGSSWMENYSSGSNADRNDESFLDQEILQSVFYSSRENVSIIHEVLRQAFLCPFQIHRSCMVRQVINVYRSWFQNHEKPIFMQEPKLCRKCPSKRQSVASATSGQLNAHLELNSLISVEDANHKTDVRVGLQQVLRVFITNSASLFMFENSSTENDSAEQQMRLEDQVDICKKMLKMYRYIVTDIILEKATWEQLLMVLLKVISTLMTADSTMLKEKPVASRLAESLFKTMMLAWVKANLSILVSQQLWKNFTETLSSFTSCIHLIRQWSKTMELLTRLLSQCIYDIDLRDLPLDKLSKRKVNRLYGANNGLKHHEKDSSLARNWLKQIMGGSYSRQQKHLPLALEVVDSRVVGVGSNNDFHMSEFLQNSVGQESQNKLSYSKCQSQFDLSSANFSSTMNSLNVHRHLPRSSSDSNILIDSRKLKVPHIHISEAEQFDVQLNSETKTHHVFHVSTDETSLQSHVQSELTDECDNNFSVAQPKFSVAESINGSDSSVLQYNAMVNRSCASSGSFNLELSNFSDRSDTEALLRMSDSQGSSSHDIYQRSKFRSLSESNSHSDEMKLPEADEEDKDEGEEDIFGCDPAAELHSIKTTNESVGEVDSLVIHDFEGKLMKQDRDSLQIEDEEAFIALCGDIAQANDGPSVGHVSGWTPDIVLVLWQRMLGCLGNVNDIKDSEMHAQVFEFLSDLLDIFIKIRENQGATKDNQTTPPEPTFVPPVLLLSSWCFEALKLPDDYKKGKLLAYQILCTSTVRKHDIGLPHDHLQRFYLVLHYGLVHSSQDVTNVLIRYCNSKFFSQSFPGSTLMMLDFIRGAQTVLQEPIDAKNVPRAEAMSLLGSLLCFQNHFQEIPVLDPDSEDVTVVKCSDIKDSILDILMKFATIEPPGRSRCIAVNALGLFLYEELFHPETLHPKLKDAFDVLLSKLKLTDKAASLTATHVLALLCDHMPLLLLKFPDLPCAVVKDMTKAITHLLTSTQSSLSEESKKIISRILIGVMFTLLEWCMKIPQILLLSYQCQNDTSLLHLVFDALDMVVNGGKRTISDSCGRKISRHSVGNDNQLTNERIPLTSVTEVGINQDISYATQKVERSDDELIALSHQRTIDEDYNGLKSAAKAIIFHLINYLNHFPMSTDGATQMSSHVEEYHDTVLEEVEQSDLSAQVLASSNTQFFVINNTALISFVEIPLQTVDQHRVTNGVATEKSACRIISRDPSGKHCWDSSILYGKQQCRSGSYSPDPPVLLRIEEEQDAELGIKDFKGFEETGSPEQLRSHTNIDDDDILDMILRYLSESSPECLLRCGEALNSSFHIPAQLNANVEELMKESMIKQQDEDEVRLHSIDKCVTSKTMKPSEHRDPLSPFQLCRLFLSQFGFITNEKRKKFDLLHKSEKLLRELKHLDNQRCRDTHKIAVIYVGPGQEDKVSILKNTAGSHSFNEFVAALAWQVNLKSHAGFMGGLQRNQTTGSIAPYYTTSTNEVIFHVSTQMPSETEEDQLRKLRHLGNDEVHIIWSEHKRDYRHGIIPTEFGDVLIVIYPLENGLFRVQIIQRPEVPSFGPLFDGAIVSFQVLPGLARATAISAGQILRTVKPHYQAFYEERMNCIDNIVKKFKMLTSFEEFSSQIFAPSPQLDAENISHANVCVNKSQVQPLTKVSKEEQTVHRKLSLAGGKQKKLKKSTSTPPQSPSFDIRHIK